MATKNPENTDKKNPSTGQPQQPSLSVLHLSLLYEATKEQIARVDALAGRVKAIEDQQAGAEVEGIIDIERENKQHQEKIKLFRDIASSLRDITGALMNNEQ